MFGKRIALFPWPSSYQLFFRGVKVSIKGSRLHRHRCNLVGSAVAIIDDFPELKKTCQLIVV